MSRGMLLVAVLALVGLCASAAFALDPMGPPRAGLEKGQTSVGLEYAYSEMDLARPVYEGTSPFELEMNKVYAKVAYGLADVCEVFLRLGVAQGDYERLGGPDYPSSSYAPWIGDGDTDFAAGVGVKATAYESGDLALGGILQVSWTHFEGDREREEVPSEGGQFEVELTEVQIAAGATYALMERISVYGGPFLHFVSGRHTNDWDGASRNSHNIEEEAILGGFIGAECTVLDNLVLQVEYMGTGDANGVGASAVWEF